MRLNVPARPVAASAATLDRVNTVHGMREAAVGQVKIGALCWNQYTEWPGMLEAGVRADGLGYDSIWTWDHLYPIVGSLERPDPRGLADTRRVGAGDPHVRIGLMVGANTFRKPAVDREDGDDARPHLAAGGQSSGIGAPGSARSTRRSGSSSGPGPRSGSAGSARRCRSCAGCSTAGADRPRRPLRAKATRNLPAPVQAHLPICVGGGGEKVTLKLVARYAT